MIINTRTVSGTELIQDLGRLEITTTPVNLGVYPLHKIASSDDLVLKIANETIIINDGEQDLQPSDAIKYVTIHNIIHGPKDPSGKLRVHQTSRKLGLQILWTGVGDDPTDITKVGGGQLMRVCHQIGEPEPEELYIDFNIIENETFIHEGYFMWDGCELDTVTAEVVTCVVSGATSTGTFYNLHSDENVTDMIIPAAGDGTFQITNDITQPHGGLVYIPLNDDGTRQSAFWNADWNNSTKLYENISAAPMGDGVFNMFATENILLRLINNLPLLRYGFMPLNSSDSDQMGQGMRFKVNCDTNNLADDHDWSVAFFLCMHRKRTK